MDTKYEAALRRIGVPADGIVHTDYERILRRAKRSQHVADRPDLHTEERRRELLEEIACEEADLLEQLGPVSIAHVELSVTEPGAREVVKFIKHHFPDCEVLCIAQVRPDVAQQYREALRDWGAELHATHESDPKPEESYVCKVEPVFMRLREKEEAARKKQEAESGVSAAEPTLACA